MLFLIWFSGPARTAYEVEVMFDSVILVCIFEIYNWFHYAFVSLLLLVIVWMGFVETINSWPYLTSTSGLGWKICLEFRGIPRLFWFWTFWTLEFSSEFYFSDHKMCSPLFWTRFFQFGILSRHRLFRFHESENIPAINVSGEWHQILIYSMHQLFLCPPLPSHCSWYLLDTHKN